MVLNLSTILSNNLSIRISLANRELMICCTVLVLILMMADWKSAAKKKIKEFTAFRTKNGKDPPRSKSINDIDHQVLDTIGRIGIIIDGIGLPITYSGNNIILLDRLQSENVETLENNDEEHMSKKIRGDTYSSMDNVPTKQKVNSRKTTLDRVTNMNTNEDENKNREILTGVVDELRGIKESLDKIAEAHQKLAKIKLAKLKLKYPGAKLEDILK